MCEYHVACVVIQTHSQTYTEHRHTNSQGEEQEGDWETRKKMGQMAFASFNAKIFGGPFTQHRLRNCPWSYASHVWTGTVVCHTPFVIHTGVVCINADYNHRATWHKRLRFILTCLHTYAPSIIQGERWISRQMQKAKGKKRVGSCTEACVLQWGKEGLPQARLC